MDMDDKDMFMIYSQYCDIRDYGISSFIIDLRIPLKD